MYSFPNFIQLFEARGRKQAGHVTRMVKNSSGWMVLTKSPKGERDGLENLGVDGSIILKSILKKNKMLWAGLIWLFIGACGCMCEDCNGLSCLQIRGSP